MNTRRRSVLWLLMLGIMAPLFAVPAQESTPASARSAAILTIDGPIGPATQHYIERGLETAREQGAALVILQMDTPGGLDTAMRGIIKAILASPIPVVTYVAPEGARAASAGTYILYASHIAAMAPATNLGAATPIQIGAPSDRGEPDKPADKTGEANGDTDEQSEERPAAGGAMERKAVNDAVAYLRSLAEKRGRNAEWAELAVREAASLSANEALEKNVIDVVARDLAELMEKIHGRSVLLESGEATLTTQGLTFERIEPDWRTELLAVLTNPSVAYILMLIGIYGLIFEGYNPGAVVPGVAGAICLLLALFAFQVLPVNYAGLALILLGVILMIAEAFAPSFGALGIGGIIAFVIGSIILMDTDVPGFGIPPLLIGSVAAVGGSMILLLIYFALQSRRHKVVSGAEAMLGAIAVALEDFTDEGRVMINGEVWKAYTNKAAHKGQRLRIVKLDGLTLAVEPEEQPLQE